MRKLSAHQIIFRSRAGDLMARADLIPAKDVESATIAPLVELDEAEAGEYGETKVQLRESERYEYELHPEIDADLRLRCSLATRRRSLGDHGKPDAGLIETSSFCGTLLLELVEGKVDGEKSALASAVLDVRSLKLDYRTEYRGMLQRLSEELADLVVDARSSAKVGFRSSFEERAEEGWLQIQLELLRNVLDSRDFSAALHRILSFPHERLSSVNDSYPTARPLKLTQAALRQLTTGNPRLIVPATHPLRINLGFDKIAQRVSMPRKIRNIDTPENRFVKFALSEFRSFLAHAQNVFEACAGWEASAAMSRRLMALVENWLGRSMFREVGDIKIVPLGSPVLQRKAGYREILRLWLRFRTAAELSWEGGEELFHAGQRDVASLYEYWLFFELLEWFCRRCRGGSRPPVEELIEGLEDGSPKLRLRKRMEIGPFAGMIVGPSRRLNALFAYNRRFEVTRHRHEGGSWTRRLHPDYTLTFWPEGLSEPEAERLELLVHVHFDAKYRVEDIEGLFGGESEDADEELEGNYKRQDLLKMHAYRDAIKRSQGAYVLYPGRSKPDLFTGFHEILPGLGAFGIAPDENGVALGLGALEGFLDKVLAHLGNRTTSQERVSYHVSEAYALGDPPITYGSLRLPETDNFCSSYRAAPPAEHLVLVAWYRNEAQRQLAEADEGFVYVRLGARRGALHVHPNLAKVRNIMLRSEAAQVASGLLILREPGFRIYTRSQLRDQLRRMGGPQGVAMWESTSGSGDEEYIYALFKTRKDEAYREQDWDGKLLMSLIEFFESDARNRPIVNLGRTSPYPRIISLRELLRTRQSP